ncbi:class I SAM-dependent methyltransferase [Miltoncostaea marina]|uniref:class I SAM-dependent methyltransferase n=1 Tax=Miltoncostaea marina TaxID=2843215 RepID=UPI001C3CB2C5|nr:methyltransferase domain-containing protein [Miltoncostaea marina]
MDAHDPPPAAAPPLERRPEDELEEVRELVAGGAPLTGSLASRFYRAVHALDPAATEESLAPLPGNRGVHLYETLVSWAPIVPGEQVVDLGCGSGGATRAAARLTGPEGMVVGIDMSPEALDEARSRTDPELPVLYRRGDVRRLGTVPDRTFDCALASMVLDTVDDLEPVLTEVFRILRPGGRFVASVTAFDRLRPIDASFMGAVIAVVGRHAPGALAGRASRASIPHEPADAYAFREVGLATVEEQDVQFAVVMEDVEDAWALFGRTYIARVLGEEGRDELRRVLERRTPHTLYLPLRFLRTRRPG